MCQLTLYVAVYAHFYRSWTPRVAVGISGVPDNEGSHKTTELYNLAAYDYT